MKEIIRTNRNAKKIKHFRLTDFTIILVLILLGLICLLPFWYEICVSFSSSKAVKAKEVFLMPVDLSLQAYQYVINRIPFWDSLLVTVKRVGLCLPISLFMMITAAYPLSKGKDKFSCRTPYVWFYFITMLFNGGMIPSYLLIVQLGLLDSIWALVLPASVNIFNLLLLLSFFRNIPTALEEAARLDGAGHWSILWRIYVPMSLPVLATVTLFTLVANWNSWFDGMIFMKSNHYPLQTYLRTIIFSYDFGNLSVSEQKKLAEMSSESVKAAQMVIGAIPILAIYPFLQKYFVTGITLGGVKE